MEIDQKPAFSWLTPWNWGWRRYVRGVVWGCAVYALSLPVVDQLFTGRMTQGSWAKLWFHSFYAPLIMLINSLLNDRR